MQNAQNDRYVDTVHFRGISLPVYADEDNNRYYTIIAGKEYLIGSLDSNYEATIKNKICEHLDAIYKFREYPGARLEFFQNGDYVDIRLVYNNRIIKVFLISKLLRIYEVENLTQKILDNLIIFSKAVLENDLR